MLGPKQMKLYYVSKNDHEEYDLVESMQGNRDGNPNAQWEGLVMP